MSAFLGSRDARGVGDGGGDGCVSGVVAVAMAGGGEGGDGEAIGGGGGDWVAEAELMRYSVLTTCSTVPPSVASAIILARRTMRAWPLQAR